MMEVVHFPFASLRQAINYIETGNPARAKYPNLYEQDRNSKPAAVQFSGFHPSDIHASATLAFESALSYFDGDYYMKRIARMYWFGKQQLEARKKAKGYSQAGEETRNYSQSDIGKELGLPQQTVSKHLMRFNAQLERELKRRQLIDPNL